MDLQFGGFGQARSPALQIFVNGVVLASALSAEVCTTGYHSADRFHAVATVSTSQQVAFSDQASLDVDIQVGLHGSWSNLVHGIVDRVTIDPLSGLMHLDGRGLAALLIAARTSESFANHTASDIAALLASRHGLTASVTATATEVGRYYQSEHDRNTLNQFARMTTEWDLLVFLAQQEGFDVFVSGTTLYFHPTNANDVSSWDLTPGDCIELRLERALTLAANVEVVVRSWNSRQQSSCVQTAKSGAVGSTGAAQQYVFVRPNMTEDQAAQFAQSMLADLTLHERTLVATIPGELVMQPRDIVTLGGTGTAFDQAYRIMQIDRSISADHGFVQHVQGMSASIASA